MGNDIFVSLSGSADRLSQVRASLMGKWTGWNSDSIRSVALSRFFLALVITYLLMAALFENFLHPLVIMFTVPMATVGGFNGGGWNRTHETGWFLAQTRLMLMQERGDELWMAPFVTRNWLKNGMTVRCQNAPTNFGRAGYLIESAVDNDMIEAIVDPPAADPPSRIVLRLRHPNEKPIKSVTVNGKPHADFDPKGETASLKPGSKQMTLRVAY